MTARAVATMAGVVFALLIGASPGYPGFCGENVDGVRIPCACGDVASGDVQIRVSDPLVQTRCPLDGLIVRAARRAEFVTIDLGGTTILGSGAGIGILVERGGADGARIVGGPPGSRAEIVGFGTGIVSAAPGALARIERIATKGNHRDGLRLREAGALLVDVSSTDNGGDGIRIVGTGGRLLGVYAARNGANGLVVVANGIIVEGTTEDNGRHGIVSSGPGSDLRSVVARGNAGSGVIAGPKQRVDGLRAEWNSMGDLRIRGGRR